MIWTHVFVCGVFVWMLLPLARWKALPHLTAKMVAVRLVAGVGVGCVAVAVPHFVPSPAVTRPPALVPFRPIGDVPSRFVYIPPSTGYGPLTRDRSGVPSYQPVIDVPPRVVNTPEPGSLALLVIGLAGLVFVRVKS